MQLHKNWRKLLKSYSFISLLANLFVAVSISGLAVLGVLSSGIAFPVLAISGAVLGGLGALGRLVDQQLDDLERDEKLYGEGQDD